jgi:hypothetical protein
MTMRSTLFGGSDGAGLDEAALHVLEPSFGEARLDRILGILLVGHVVDREHLAGGPTTSANNSV